MTLDKSQYLPTSLSEQRYAELYSLIVDISREFVPMKKALLKVIREHCPDHYSLLDIGAGWGHFVRDVMLDTDQCLAKYGAYEPNEHHFKVLQKNTRSLAKHLELLKQPFTPEAVLEPSWDLILMSFSLFWMQPVGEHVRAALSGLKPGGVLVIFLPPPAGFYMVQNQFREWLGKRENGLEIHVCTVELMSELKALAIKATETLLPSYMDLSEYWEDEVAMRDLGSFILGGELGSLPEAVQQSMVEHIRANTLQLDQLKLFNQPTSMVLVFSQ